MSCGFALIAAGTTLVSGCALSGDRTASTQTRVEPPRSQAREPYFNARSHTAEYAGPGRDEPPPQNINEVRIGWFGPADLTHPTAGQMWAAATMAVDEANEAGGCNGLPFRLVPAWSENPWGTGIRDVTRLVYDEKVWAIVGGPNGPSAHLVEQVVAKARLTYISPVSTDKTANLANVPWIFSCAPGDHLLAPILADALVSQAAGAGFAVVSCTDHDSRVLTTELLNACNRLGAFPILHVEFNPGAADFDAHIERLRQAQPGAVALIAGPRDSARSLIAMRRAGLDMPVLGGPAMGRRLFAETAAESAEGVLFPLIWHPSAAGDRPDGFARRFERSFGFAPDYTAACTYDAVRLLIDAVHTAGLNRARIRDAVRALSPWPGVTGPINWDPTGQNDRPAALGMLRRGQVVPMPQPKPGAGPGAQVASPAAR
ncbi:MAG TPA: ABC transporter substrate-binding protein [Phycisphaerae bacterium]|nr:ABC transporter substrate-binding protein [Phycisphaerae bacterium]